MDRRSHKPTFIEKRPRRSTMKNAPLSILALTLAWLLSSAGCGGADQTATTKSPEEIKKEYVNRAEHIRQDNASKK
jgi:hypothetical protein